METLRGIGRMQSPFSIMGWIGLALFVVGLVLLIFGSPTKVELIGSICSIVGLIWVAMDNRLTRIERILIEIRDSLKR
ncbi:MAG: hypothetical protein QMC77_07855 [Methanocellales archaeon]|nr:hypothetical protein [Methanocellales archaeon]